MTRHPLRVLLRLREIALDTARRALADRLREEAAARARCQEIADTIARETEVQRRQAADGHTTGSYAAWLGRIQAVHREAQAAARACAAVTAAAQTALSEARAGTRVLESALEELQEQSRNVAARQAQLAADEVASGRHRRDR